MINLEILLDKLNIIHIIQLLELLIELFKLNKEFLIKLILIQEVMIIEKYLYIFFILMKY